MKIDLLGPQPGLAAMVLVCPVLALAARDASVTVPIRQGIASAELLELDALVAHINGFWLAQPAPAASGRCR